MSKTITKKDNSNKTKIGIMRHAKKALTDDGVDNLIKGRDQDNLVNFFQSATDLVYHQAKSVPFLKKDHVFDDVYDEDIDLSGDVDFSDEESLKKLCNQAADPAKKSELFQKGIADKYLTALTNAENSDDFEEKNIGLIAAGFSNLLNSKDAKEWLEKGDNSENTKKVLTSLSTNIKDSKSLSHIATCFVSINRENEDFAKDEGNPDLVKKVVNEIAVSGKKIAENDQPKKSQDAAGFCLAVIKFSYMDIKNEYDFRQAGAEDSIMNIIHNNKEYDAKTASYACRALVNLNLHSGPNGKYFKDENTKKTLLDLVESSVEGLAQKDSAIDNAGVLMASASYIDLARVRGGNSSIYKDEEIKSSFGKIFDDGKKLEQLPKKEKDQLVGRTFSMLSHTIAGPKFDQKLFESMLDASKDISTPVSIGFASRGIARALDSAEGSKWLENDDNYKKAQSIVVGYYKHAFDPVDLESSSKALSVINRGRERVKGLGGELEKSNSNAEGEVKLNDVKAESVQVEKKPAKDTVPEQKAQPAIAAAKEEAVVPKQPAIAAAEKEVAAPNQSSIAAVDKEPASSKNAKDLRGFVRGMTEGTNETTDLWVDRYPKAKTALQNIREKIDDGGNIKNPTSHVARVQGNNASSKTASVAKESASSETTSVNTR